MTGLWEAYERPMEGVWEAYRHMTGVWEAYERPMEGLWEAYEKPMRGLLEAYEKHMTGLWTKTTENPIYFNGFQELLFSPCVFLVFLMFITNNKKSKFHWENWSFYGHITKNISFPNCFCCFYCIIHLSVSNWKNIGKIINWGTNNLNKLIKSLKSIGFSHIA